MPKRNKERRKLIKIQNQHGKKLGKAIFERDAKAKQKPVEDIFVLKA